MLESTSFALTVMTFNSLLGFSSFESDEDHYLGAADLVPLSIPYWDFLVLNPLFAFTRIQ